MFFIRVYPYVLIILYGGVLSTVMYCLTSSRWCFVIWSDEKKGAEAPCGVDVIG